ncbi:MAG: MBL fold metallo-hydrolase [Crocinitomicaceae bacterium]|nr:MBL fold metallo-hydrolase [Crocinitomicaceae bacterium]
MRGIFLGTGTSQGIPVIACDCHVCTSPDAKDKRLRSSFLLELPAGNVVIDTGPDFRQQMLSNEVKRLDAILYTHEHKDHVAGMDDVRAFNFKMKKDMEVYATENVQKALKREFHYVFEAVRYPGVPRVNLNTITTNSFELLGEEIIPILVYHYKLPVLGFRVRNFAYITDAKTIPEEEKLKMKDLDILVLNALRKEPHMSHLTLEEALELIYELKPKKAYLTHISHLFGRHAEDHGLPDHVEIAYDGLTIDIA